MTEPINVFDFTVSRHRDGPEIFLSGFEGVLLADCYAGYEAIELGSAGKIRRAACVAHARRKVFEARSNHPAHAAMLLGLFQRLYDSAVRNDLDVFVYVKDVLDRLLAGSHDYAGLRPDVWKLAHPEAVRVYREDERRHRAEVKSAKRARRCTGRR